MGLRCLWNSIAGVLVVVTLAGGASLTWAEELGVSNWRLKTANGKTVVFHDELKQGPVLVSFWALWCAPCLKELPHLNELAKEYEDQLSVLAVNIDSPKSVARVRPYIRSKKYEFIVPMDTSGEITRLMQVGKNVPFLVLYDTDGREAYRHAGYKDGDEVELRKQVQLLFGGASEDEGE